MVKKLLQKSSHKESTAGRIFAFLSYSLLLVAVILLAILIYYETRDSNSFGSFSTLVAIFLISLITLLCIILILLMGRKPSSAINFSLIVISIVFIYALVDMVAGRLFLSNISPRSIPDDIVHHKMTPNIYSQIRGVEYNYLQRVNNLGLRGKDVTLSKGKDILRILMLGDSFTMGKAVGDKETFTAILEKRLNRSDKKYEIINAGVDSYSPILSYLQLSKQLKNLQADMVVLNLDMSDLIQEQVYRKLALYDNKKQLIGISGDRSKRHSIVKWVRSRLYLTSLLLYFVEKCAEGEKIHTVTNVVSLANPDLLKHTLAEDKADRSEEWNNIFDSILKIKDYCERNGMQFLLAVYPWGHQVNEREWIPGRYKFVPRGSIISDKSIIRIENFAEQNSINICNLFEAFRSFPKKSALYYKYDQHFTHEGHQLFAETLEECLLGLALVKH